MAEAKVCANKQRLWAAMPKDKNHCQSDCQKSQAAGKHILAQAFPPGGAKAKAFGKAVAFAIMEKQISSITRNCQSGKSRKVLEGSPLVILGKRAT